MTRTRQHRLLSVLALGLVAVAGRAFGLPAYGPLQVTGNVQTQTLIRHPDWDQYQFIQNRNTLKLRMDLEAVRDGKLLDRADVPGVRSTHLYLLYRGVYDSLYDIAPGGNLHDILGQRAGTIADLGGDTRDALKFENTLREAYVDIDLSAAPFSFRLGRQQVVWGETDNFRMLDRANPLDMTWHQMYESWDDLRVPLWMVKALWRLDQVGPLSEAFIETYWTPGDWYPAKQSFLPQRPWGVSQVSPLNGLIGAGSPFGFTSLFRDTRLFRQGDYSRDPGDNSQVGVRVSAMTPQGVQFSLNYFYQRFAGDDGTNYAPQRALTDPDDLKEARRNNQLPAEFIAPYVHTIGASLNYSDEDYTGTVYRLETIYDMGVPFSDRAKPALSPLLRGRAFGVTKRDMWKGMLGFDRPTWIRTLNRTSTFFLSGQFFWHYLIDRENTFVGNVDPSTPSNDKVRRWETIATALLTTFYSGGTIVPTLSYALDPVNSYNMYVGWTLDYFFTNELIGRIGQNYFLTAGHVPAFESWSLGGFNRGRSEALARLTYQF